MAVWHYMTAYCDIAANTPFIKEDGDDDLFFFVRISLLYRAAIPLCILSQE